MSYALSVERILNGCHCYHSYWILALNTVMSKLNCNHLLLHTKYLHKMYIIIGVFNFSCKWLCYEDYFTEDYCQLGCVNETRLQIKDYYIWHYISGNVQ